MEEKEDLKLFFAENLKFLRKRKKWTQLELAEQLSIERPVIGAYETGKSRPNIELLTEIAELLEVSLDALLRINLTVELSTGKSLENFKFHHKKNQMEDAIIQSMEFQIETNTKLFDFAEKMLKPDMNEDDNSWEDIAENLILESWDVLLDKNPEFVQNQEKQALITKLERILVTKITRLVRRMKNKTK